MAAKIDRLTKCSRCRYSQSEAEAWNRKAALVFKNASPFFVDEMRILSVCSACGRVFCEECCRIVRGEAVCKGCLDSSHSKQPSLNFAERGDG